jgi:hypothetical protein
MLQNKCIPKKNNSNILLVVKVQVEKKYSQHSEIIDD